MEIDKHYLIELTRPFYANAAPTISEYLRELDSNDVVYKESKNRLSERFIFHIEYLIDSGYIIGPNRELPGISQLGLKIYPDRSAIVLDDRPVRYIKPAKLKIVKPVLIWFRDHTLGAIISALVVAMILVAIGVNV
ncbi:MULTISPECIES: hypothetical protein [Vibrio]|uniref:hypothetical protein n=1 Tax=Vibrio TaxID=662 RepID=UPI001C3044F4|nr:MULTISPECIES: hypothetical protein [Vibrio]